MTPSPRKYYPHLDTLRALAALWVCIYHINIIFDLQPYLKGFYPTFFRIASNGELGVDIFFVLSGFLISGLLYPELETQLRIKRFYVRRSFKILPQYLIATLIGLAISASIQPFTTNFIAVDHSNAAYFVTSFSSHDPNSNILSHFLFYQNFTVPVGILGHTRSLAIEEHFYFLFPLLLVLITKLTPQPDQRKKLLIITFLALMIFHIALKQYYIHGKELFPSFIHNRYEAIMVGCLLKLAEPMLLRVSQARWRIYSHVFLLAGLGIFLYYIYFGFVRFSIFGYPLASLAAGMLILSFIRDETPGGWLRKFVNNKILISIGRVSYGIYLWHYILIFVFYKFERFLGTPVTVVAYLAAAIGAGYLSTYTIENYFLRMRARLFP